MKKSPKELLAELKDKKEELTSMILGQSKEIDEGNYSKGDDILLVDVDDENRIYSYTIEYSKGERVVITSDGPVPSTIPEGNYLGVVIGYNYEPSDSAFWYRVKLDMTNNILNHCDSSEIMLVPENSEKYIRTTFDIEAYRKDIKMKELLKLGKHIQIKNNSIFKEMGHDKVTGEIKSLNLDGTGGSIKCDQTSAMECFDINNGQYEEIEASASFNSDDIPF